MKYALLMLIAVSFNGVAGEVDALNSPMQSTIEIAAVDTGVDARWTALPNDKKASNRETRNFEDRVEVISADLSIDLDTMTSTKLDSLIEKLED